MLPLKNRTHTLMTFARSSILGQNIGVLTGLYALDELLAPKATNWLCEIFNLIGTVCRSVTYVALEPSTDTCKFAANLIFHPAVVIIFSSRIVNYQQLFSTFEVRRSCWMQLVTAKCTIDLELTPTTIEKLPL